MVLLFQKTPAMAGLKTALVIALILALSYQPTTAGPPGSPSECCFEYSTGGPRRIRNIASYYKTNRECNLKAVVLVMKNKFEICVDPTLSWVRTALPKLKEKKPSRI